MKKSILFVLALLTVLFLGCLRSLEKEGINPETIYKGRVIDSKNTPLSKIPVKITNGSLTHNSTITDANGLFEVSVDITKIDDKYYIQVGDENSSIKPLVSSLKGFGLDVYEYGDISYENIYVPIVETVELVNLTKNSFTCKCNVKSQGGAPLKERGLCWGVNIPTIDDHKVPFGNGEGYYTCVVSDASINVSTTTYYACAYAINEYGVAYGEPIKINSSRLEYFSLPKFEYGGFTYRLHPDLGGMTWSQAETACKNLTAYDFNDWFLPNKEELFAMADEGFLNKADFYWTSSSYSHLSAMHYTIYFEDNDWFIEGVNDDDYIFHVIPVRKDNSGDN